MKKATPSLSGRGCKRTQSMRRKTIKILTMYHCATKKIDATNVFDPKSPCPHLTPVYLPMLLTWAFGSATSTPNELPFLLTLSIGPFQPIQPLGPRINPLPSWISSHKPFPERSQLPITPESTRMAAVGGSLLFIRSENPRSTGRGYVYAVNPPEDNDPDEKCGRGGPASEMEKTEDGER